MKTLFRISFALFAIAVFPLGNKAQASVVITTSAETIFNFDLTSGSPLPPFDAISYQVAFDPTDPISGTDVIYTYVYGGLGGTELVQVRNDTNYIINNTGGLTAGGTTANPIYEPMYDGLFSFGLKMISGTALVNSFEACGVIYGTPLMQTCSTLTASNPVPIPAALPLLLSGFAGLGLIGRTNRT